MASIASQVVAAGAPIFVKSFVNVLSFHRDYDSGRARLRLEDWRQHRSARNRFQAPEHQATSWFINGTWNVALEHRSDRFDHGLDRRVARAVFGAPTSAFILPSAIVVPLIAKAGRRDHLRQRRCGDPHAVSPVLEGDISNELVAFRIRTSARSDARQSYAEATFSKALRLCPAELGRAATERRLSTIGSAASVVAQALMFLPQFIRCEGFQFDVLGERADLVHAGSYGALPRHGSLYAELSWPVSTETVLLAFEATPNQRVASTAIASSVVAEVDESALDGKFLTWRA